MIGVSSLSVSSIAARSSPKFRMWTSSTFGSRASERSNAASSAKSLNGPASSSTRRGYSSRSAGLPGSSAASATRLAGTTPGAAGTWFESAAPSRSE